FDSSLVLKSISVDIMAAEKIEIVGRTETSRSIVIDDININTIGLRDLR
ncbi:12046_t:CDS:2, partial [Dentiscutata heterogama]